MQKASYMKTISKEVIEFIARLEGMRRNVYLDEGGYPTIGIGHLLTGAERASGNIFIDGEECPIARGLTIAQCCKLLKADLKNPAATVNQSVLVEINRNQFDALVSFVFNVGGSAFTHSKLLQCINRGEFKLVPEQLRRWVFVNGRRSEGLRRRREAEIVLWNTPVNEEAFAGSMRKIGRIDPPTPRKSWYAKLFWFMR
mgnify:FL=1